MKNEKYCALGGKKSNAIRRSSSHKQQVLGGCYALILPYFCHEFNFLFSRNMICQKMRNTVCLVERNPMQQEKAGNCSVTLWLWEGEEGGEGCSLPVAHQSGRSTILNISGNSLDLFVNVLRFFFILTVHWGRRSAPHLWEGLDRPHYFFLYLSLSFCVSCNFHGW